MVFSSSNIADLYFFLGCIHWGFPGGSVVKNLPANAGDAGDGGSIPGSGRSPREGNGNRLQCSSLQNSMDGGAWQAAIHGLQRVRHDRTHTHAFTTDFLVLLAYVLANPVCWFDKNTK